MQPGYIFFTELPSIDLDALVQNDKVLELLQRYKAGICMGLVDLNDERANIVRELNQANIPVIAGILVSEDAGYWANVSNARVTAEKYGQVRLWAIDHGLVFDAVGIHCLPHINLFRSWVKKDIGSMFRSLSGFFKPWQFNKAKSIYQDLAAQIKADGYRLESFVPSFVYDERIVKSRLLKTLLGIVDIPSDREILILQANTIQAHNLGLIWSYGRETSSFGIRSTDSVTWSAETDPEPIKWSDFKKSVHHAWYWSNTIYIYSLEGCIQQDIFDKIFSIKLDDLILEPKQLIERIDRSRISLQALLWGVTYLPLLIFMGIVAIFLFRYHRKRDDL
jgi:hypothetical protein